ncbi:HEAT repeat [Agrococcus baldri]|uniref:HEAT repeat n=1 Tax=Agrococcus baldri TaxID=153730 RepID=A0AA94KZ35_9MICO|nr:HEAT repeat domain-containing protein [Agrococcus baldri]SFS06683.1 HEAT repeat [Agrococcus baldri]
MSWLTDGVMQAVLLITAGIALGMLVSLVVQRTVRRRRASVRARLDERIRPLVLAATVAEDDETDALIARVRALGPDERAHVRRTVFGMLRDVTGEAAERLRAVGDAAGIVPRVLALSEHRSPALRASAAEALGLLQPPGSLELLCRLAADPAPAVRTVAVRALGAYTEPVAVDRVIAALAIGSGVPNNAAASALLQQGLAAGDRVRLALDHPDAGVRRGAARVAGLLQAPGVAERLVGLLEDEEESVRLAAIRSLERLPVAAAVPALLDAALADGRDGEAAATTLAAMPPAWTAAALARIEAEGAPAVRRAAGIARGAVA